MSDGLVDLLSVKATRAFHINNCFIRNGFSFKLFLKQLPIQQYLNKCEYRKKEECYNLDRQTTQKTFLVIRSK